MVSWLITGGCGFIGQNLIAQIQKAYPKSSIRVFDNLSIGSIGDLPHSSSDPLVVENVISSPRGVELYLGDIRDLESCQVAAIGCNRVVHLAGHTGVGPSVSKPMHDFEQNALGTHNMLEAARKNDVEKFVFASSGAAVGNVSIPPIHEELACHPMSPYGASKLAGEGYCQAYWHSYGLNTSILRFGNVYGPGSQRKESVIAKFTKRALAGEVCEIYGDGTQTRDFIYVADLCDAIIASSEYRVGGEVFQIASGKEVSLNELVTALSEAFESVTGRTMEFKQAAERLGDVYRNYSDTEKANQRLKWTPKTSLLTGLAQTIEYLTGMEDQLRQSTPR